MGRGAEISLLYNAVLNGPAVQLTRYPLIAVGVTVTQSGAAYAYKAAGANQVVMFLAAANATGLWLCGAAIATPSVVTTDIWVLWIGRGVATAPAVRAAEFQFLVHQVTAVGQFGLGAQFLPLPLYFSAGVPCAADVATSGAAGETAAASVFMVSGLGA